MRYLGIGVGHKGQHNMYPNDEVEEREPESATHGPNTDDNTDDDEHSPSGMGDEDGHMEEGADGSDEEKTDDEEEEEEEDISDEELDDDDLGIDDSG